MPGIRNRVKSIRNATWGNGGKDGAASARDVGESIRDIDRAWRTNLTLNRIDLSQAYTPPIAISSPFVPAALIVGKVQVTRDITFVPGVSADWSYVGGEIRISKLSNSAGELVVGTSYDITIVVIG
jgi:hypothetical protein